jgi:cell division protein FtsZ
MIKQGMTGPTLIAANTDVEHLERCLAPVKIQLGPELTEGLGAGGDPSVGCQATEESMPEIMEEIGDAHLVFVTAGLGGGTGTGAAPAVVRHLNKQKKPPLVVSVVVLPFKEEIGRPEKAKPAYEELLAISNSVITVSNDRLFETFPEISMPEVSLRADLVLYKAVSCVTDLIYNPGDIHLDFADIRTAFRAKGLAIMGVGEANGPDRCVEAAKSAINCPLMDNKPITGAKYLLINLTVPKDIKASEFLGVNKYLVELVGPGVQVLTGITYDDSLAESGTVRVTVIATGLPVDEPQKEEPMINLDDDEDEPITLLMEVEPKISLPPDQAQRPAPQAQSQYPDQAQAQGQGQYPGQIQGQGQVRGPGQYPNQPRPSQYPGQPQGQYPGQAQDQYPPQGPSQYPGQPQGQYPNQAHNGAEGQVQTPGQTSMPKARQTVKLSNEPLDRVPTLVGNNKYAQNGFAVAPLNVVKKANAQRNPSPTDQRNLLGQSKRGLAEARKDDKGPYMHDKAN